jgi:STE24 endopeptidase
MAQSSIGRVCESSLMKRHRDLDKLLASRANVVDGIDHPGQPSTTPKVRHRTDSSCGELPGLQRCFSCKRVFIIDTLMTRHWIFILLAVGSLLALMPVSAEENPTQTPSLAGSENAKAFDPAAATQAWLATVPRETRERSDAYFEGGYWLILWNFLLAIAISIFLLASRISARLRDFAERICRGRRQLPLQIMLYAIPYFLLMAVLSFPLNLYQNFYREHQYGLATQSFLPWFREQFIGLVVTLIAGTILLIVLYAVFRRAPRTWWIWGTVVAVMFLFAGALIAPVYIEPLFNTYKPLTDPKVRNPILAMARANEIPVTQVLEVDASRQTTRVSANVSGFLGTSRIALNDNLLKQCTLPEIRMVMAHEMGHYVLNHVTKLITYFAIFILIGFALARTVFEAAVSRWGHRWGVRGIADPAGLPLLVLILSTLLFIALPFLNTVVRVTEREADAFGINTSREPAGMATVALKLGAYRKLDPTPLEEFIFFDHPSGRARIRMAMDWKAANLPVGEATTAKTRSSSPSALHSSNF